MRKRFGPFEDVAVVGEQGERFEERGHVLLPGVRLQVVDATIASCRRACRPSRSSRTHVLRVALIGTTERRPPLISAQRAIMSSQVSGYVSPARRTSLVVPDAVDRQRSRGRLLRRRRRQSCEPGTKVSAKMAPSVS